MLPPLKALSELLEARRPTLTSDDLASMPGDLRGLLLDSGLLAAARPATHVTCDACYDDHVEEVVSVKDAKGVRFQIPCPEAGWVEVPEHRLRQWTLDDRKVVAALAAAISPGSQADELLMGVAWRIGSVSLANEIYEIVFLRRDEGAADSVVTELSQRIPPARTIVIESNPRPESATAFAASLPLPSAFDFTDSRLSFHEDRVRALVSAQGTVAGNVFRRRGEYWELSFDGHLINLKDSVGLGYIARLLMEPNRDIPAVTLLAARAGIDPLVSSGSSGGVLDGQAREEYGRRYRELQEELCEARKNNDLGQIEKLEGEMEQLTSELASATGLGGRSRQKADIEKVRKSVREAINRDIGRIGKQHESLENHLTAFIITGQTCRYAPERDPGWLT